MIILPKFLLKRVLKNLKLEVSQLKEEDYYSKNLLNKKYFLEELKKNNAYKSFASNNINNNCLNENLNSFFVMYIISISFSRSNTIIHITDIKGNMKKFYTSGSVNLAGKQKKNRKFALLRLISLISKNGSFIRNKPVAVHLINVKSHKHLIISKLKQIFYVKILKSFYKFPFNGCRNKKVRRKKYSKIFIK